MVISLYNSQGAFVGHADAADMCITETPNAQEKTAAFTTDERAANTIRVETTFVYDGIRYIVKDIRPPDTSGRVSVECVIDLTDFDGVFVEGFSPPDLCYSAHEGIDYGNSYEALYDPDNSSPAYIAQDVISGMYHAGFIPAGWTFRYVVPPLAPGEEPITGRNYLTFSGVFEVDKMTAAEALSLLVEMLDNYPAWRIDNVNKVVSIGAIGYGDRAYGHRVPFVAGHNLRRLVRMESSRQMATRLYAYGKDGLTMASANGGRDYVDNFTYTNKVIVAVWTNSAIQNPVQLKEAAVNRLNILSAPTKSYEADVVNLASIRDAPEIAYSVGDYALVEDHAAGVSELLRIVKTVTYPENPEDDSVALANLTPTLEEFDRQMARMAAGWAMVTNQDGSINGVYVHGVRAGDVVGIETVITEQGTVRSAVESVVHDVIGS